MNTTTQPTCPKCGTRLRAVDGLCPTCVARVITSFVKGPATRPVDDEPSVPGYEIIEIIGRGGMGVVYRAIRLEDEREVALKLMPPHLSDRADLLERLQREADALDALVHPHVIRVIESGITRDGRWFMATELAVGGDLGKRLQKGPLPVEEALRLFRQIVEAIAVAHERGIAHRDIKPANILLDADGSARVADFSLAKLLRNEDAVNFTLTQSTEVFGTPYYIAPEVRSGSGGVDERADIFSLGVLLHEMLTGRLPIGQYLPASKQVKVPAAIDRLISRCLQEDPARRPASARDVLRKLEEHRGMRVTGWMGLIGLISLICVFGAALIASLGKRESEPAASASIIAATAEQPWKNSLGMKFVPVPGTSVLFSIWETRRRDFLAFATATKQSETGPLTRWRHSEQPTDENHPVTPVSVMMTGEFCTWLTLRERGTGLIGAEDEYRLPSDDEWSRAATLPVETGVTPELRQKNAATQDHPLYAWGREWPPMQIGQFANFAGRETRASPRSQSLLHTDAFPFTAPVGSHKANSLGIHDLGGNVSEWTSSRWNDKTEARVLRGGSWRDYDPAFLRLDFRQQSLPNALPEGSGFRLVLDLASKRPKSRR